jgi:hypothetical protein
MGIDKNAEKQDINSRNEVLLECEGIHTEG